MNTKLKAALIVLVTTFALEAFAHALSGTYVYTNKTAVIKFTLNENGTWTSDARDPNNKRRHQTGKGTYSVAKNNKMVTLATSGINCHMTVERNGDLYEKASNVRLRREK